MEFKDYLEAVYKGDSPEVREVMTRAAERKAKRLTEPHPNAIHNIPKTEKQKEFTDSLKRGDMVNKFYRKMLEKAIDFDLELFNKYHKDANLIGNHDADFKDALAKLMNGNAKANEKWIKFKEFMVKSIENWNIKQSKNGGKRIT